MRHVILGAVIGMLGGLPATAQDLPFAPGAEARFDWAGYDAFARAHDLTGQSLSILGPWTGADADLISSVLAYFNDATGARAVYSGSGDFEQSVTVAANAGSPPDLAVFPQPGLVADLARRGLIVPLDADTADTVRAVYAAGDAWVDLATFPGPDAAAALYGVFYKVDAKSLVWYVPDRFEEGGYDIPRTLDALRVLTAQIAADGQVPWCIGLGSGEATGWPATDWVEDLLLRGAGAAIYDDWVAHRIPFDAPAIVAAIEDYGWFARNDAFTGGAQRIATTDFRDSPQGLFALPPDCLMHKQGTFIPTFFPQSTILGTDADFFYFPGTTPDERPVLGGGTMFSILRDSVAARALVDFLLQPIAHEIWMAQSGFLSPHLRVDPAAYANDTQRALGQVLTQATTFRFDASDRMPSEIGTSAFWSAMVDYTTGRAEADRAAAGVEARWQSIR